MTITPLPILIDSDPEDADGVLVRSRSHSFTKVRAISAEEIEARVLKGKTFSPKDEEWGLYDALRKMRVAVAGWDMPAFQKALDKARQWLAFPVGQGMQVTDWDAARWAYSSLLSNAVESVRTAAWFPHEPKTWAAPLGEEGDRWAAPGFYCGNEKTAAFLMLFMDYLRVCQLAKCMQLYVPKTTTQKCCCQKHGNSARVKRCIDKKKEEARAEQARMLAQQGTARKKRAKKHR